jgi:hypothetical protein
MVQVEARHPLLRKRKGKQSVIKKILKHPETVTQSVSGVGSWGLRRCSHLVIFLRDHLGLFGMIEEQMLQHLP